jgi:hypothetical protein
LQHDLRAVVDGRFEGRQSLFALAFAVVARQQHGPHALCGGDAAAGIDPLDRPGHVAHHRFTGVGKGAAQALDQGQANGRGRLGMGGHKTQGGGTGQQRASRKKGQ